MEAPAVSGPVFFSRDWTLEERLDSEQPMGSSLARAVLRLGEGLPLATRFRGAFRNGRIQVERATLLLREALRREREGATTHRDEFWRFIHEEWTALSRSAPAKEFLRGLAVSIGIAKEKVDAEVEALLGAIRSELLPGVHALLYTGSGTREGFHLERWRTAQRQGSQVSSVLTSALLTCLISSAREAVQKESYLSALGLFEEVLKSLPPSWSRELLGHEACLVAEQWVLSRKNAPQWTLGEVLTTLARLGALVPHDFGLRQLRSAVHIKIGLGLIQEENRFSDGAVHLVGARLLDPLNPSPGRLLQQTDELLSKRYARVLNARRQGHSLNELGARLLQEGQRGLGPSHAFVDTPQGRALAAETWTAMQGEAMLRLGLLPSSSAARSAMDAFCSALVRSAYSGWHDALREQLCVEHPLLEQIRWEELEELRGRALSLRPEVLATHLPPPPALSLDEASTGLLAAGWRRTCEQGIAAGASSGRKVIDRWVFYPWLFSRRDLFAKGAALAGALLLVVGTVGLCVQVWDESRREAAFQRFVVAQQARDLSRVAEASRDFLAWDSAGRDPRLEQVAQAYRDALLRAAIDAGRTGNSEHVQRLSREGDTLEARLELLGTPGLPVASAKGGAL